MSQRHRLTITITLELYEKLCRLAEPRRMSHWMEDAAWRKIRDLAEGDGPAELPTRSAELDNRPLPGRPIPLWRWSPLQPRNPDPED